MGQIADNYNEVRVRLAAAAVMAGRDPFAVRLVTVSKTIPAARVVEAVEAGACILGENRVQEAIAKMTAPEFAALAVQPAWHLIGTLQKNKAKYVVGAFELIHSVDGIELAREIDRQAAKRGIIQDGLLEINIADEPTKHGLRPEEAVPLVLEIAHLKNIRITGLMCVPPFTDDPEDSRPHFVALRGLLADINRAGVPMTELSMGMTQDYEVAAAEGATLVRVGTAIFGARACAL